jgi:hypothetical protein
MEPTPGAGFPDGEEIDVVRPLLNLMVSQSVEAISVDEYVQKNGIAKVEFIKIDVEGAEASVLDGATVVLDRDKPILLIELHELDRFKDKHPAILKLRDHNYQVRSLGIRQWQEHVIAEPLGKPQMHLK